MRVRIFEGASLSIEDEALVRKLREAVAEQKFELKDTRGGTHAAMSVGAYVFSGPLRVDFEISSEEDVRENFQGAFIGPQLPLTSELFDGHSLKSTTLKQVSEAFDDFAEYWQKVSA